MRMFEENGGGELEACLKTKLGDRLRALQENASKWQPKKTEHEESKTFQTLQERRKVFALNETSQNRTPSFSLRKPLRLNPIKNNDYQFNSFETIKVLKRSATLEHKGDASSRVDKSESVSPRPRRFTEAVKISRQIEVNDTTDAENDEIKREEVEVIGPQVLKNNREQSENLDMSANEEEKGNRPSHFLPTAKRTVSRPIRRVPTRFQTAASGTPMPTVSLNSELHLETENKENQEQDVVPKRPSFRVSSVVPFQIPVIGKEHCGVQLRNVNRSAPFPDPMLIRALCVGKQVDLRLIYPSKSSLTEHGSYLLVTSKQLIIRNGKEATVQERSKITQLAHNVIAGKEMFGYSGKPDLANEDSLAEAAFWRHLGENVEDHSHLGENVGENESVVDFQQLYPQSFAFYRIDDSGEPVRLDVESVSASVLDSNQIMVLDFGSEIYTWLGRSCNRSLSKFASEFVEKLKTTPLSQEMCKFIGSKEDPQTRPSWILRKRLSEGISDSLFKHKFPRDTVLSKSSEPPLKSTQDLKYSANKLPSDFRPKPTNLAPRNPQMKDEDALARELAAKFAQSSQSKDYFLELEDTRIYPFDPNVFTERLNFFVLNGESLDILDKQPTEFDCRKCYVVEWRYRVERGGIRKLNDDEAKKHDTGRERGVYFYWLGQCSTVKEQSFCALALRNKDRERLEHIRTEQGREHPLFISLFTDKGFIVSGTDTETFLFHSYGSEGNLLSMVELRDHAKGRGQTAVAKIVGDQLKCQRGKYCPEGVWKNAQRLAETMAGIRNLRLTCSETVEFDSMEPLSWKESPRFYRIYELEGEELLTNRAHFTFPAHQSDLDDGFILVENDNFLWLWSEGVVSTFALKVANNFWTLERKMNKNATVICKGSEPTEFMALFSEWKEDTEEGHQHKPPRPLDQLLDERTVTRSLKDVREKKLPEGSDLKRLELYLSPEDFEAVFKMSKEEFDRLPSWKQIRLKKENGLF